MRQAQFGEQRPHQVAGLTIIGLSREEIVSTEKTWMSADQFADVLELYADCREHYVVPGHREPGAFHNAPASAQWLMCEVDAYRTAARILRHLDETPIGCHTAMTGVWERGIDAIRHGDKPVTT